VEQETGSLGSLRRSNRAKVVEAMSAIGVASRAGIARRTGLSRSTVSSIVAELQDEGLIVASGSNGSAPAPSGGRPPSLLSLDPAAGVAVGIDFGKTHLAMAVADLAHNVMAEEHRELADRLEAGQAMALAAELLEELLERAQVERSRVLGVGMGLPGPIRASGEVGSSAILPGWVGVSAAAEMEDVVGLPVRVANDANLGALAEQAWGAGRGCSTLAYLKLATGIGAGLIVDSQLWEGAGGTAGEIGHTSVDEGGALCRCGNRGCLETVAGAPAIVGPLARRLGEDLDIDAVVERAREGDRDCAGALAEAGRSIGLAAADLCNLVNPERIIVGGSVGAAGDPVLAPLRDAVRRRAIPSAAEDVEIVPGELGERAELLGAVALVLRQASLTVPGAARAEMAGTR
jgi:predicted NBD/HSP70 family sugar kinase